MTGQTVSHYKVLEKLGAGGMGVVYKAEDTRLGRQVALKFLPEAVANDPQALQRFEREARAVSSLNHSNICTLYDIGEYDRLPFLVLELLSGSTLQERIAKGPLPIEEALDLAIEVCDALVAAHSRGIVHRDIKPGNIFVSLRADGSVQAKVLDFGLAKTGGAAAGEEAVTVTTSGTAMGTVRYMSPEQARGQDIDARSDLFSFGAVLYEMVTGTRAFAGESIGTTFEAILNRTPAPIRERNPKVPAELERIVSRALEKDRDVRYQTAADLLAGLKRLKRERELGAPLKRRSWPIVAALAVVLVGAAVFAFFQSKAPPPPPAATEWQAITNFTDSATQPALSPDGRQIAYIRGPGTFYTSGQIEVKALPDGEPVQLTHDSFSKMSPAFSPDGSRITYTAVDLNFRWDTWVAPVQGGEPVRMLPNASGLTWLDPGNVLFSEMKIGVNMGVVTSASNRAAERDIYLPPQQRGMAHRSARSPDGRRVIAAEMNNGGWLPCRVVPFDGASSGARVGPSNGGCIEAAWSPDGQWMYLNVDTGAGYHIWRQRASGGTPEQITFGPTEQSGIAVSPDGRSLITSVGSRQSTVWIHDAAGDRQISSEGTAAQPLLSADGHRLYYLVRSDASADVINRMAGGELWMADLAAGRRQRLLPGFEIVEYRISRDDRTMVFTARDRQGKSHVWIAPLDMRTPPQQVLTASDDMVYFGPEGDLLFLGTEGGVSYLCRSKIDGSGRQRVLTQPILRIEGASPDGNRAIVWSAVSGGDLSIPSARFVVPVPGGDPVRVCDWCDLSWARSQRYLYLMWGTSAGMNEHRTYYIPLPDGKMLPNIPAGGLETRADVEALPGAKFMDANRITPGPDPSIYAHVKETAHRNLYRIPLP